MANDYEIINGKPHLGVFFANSLIVNGSYSLELEEEKLRLSLQKTPKDLENRHVKIIHRTPLTIGPLQINGSIAIKYMIWGRAYKVMRLVKKGKKRYKKVYICGRRKRVRVDK